jgi:hypothetical protein
VGRQERVPATSRLRIGELAPSPGAVRRLAGAVDAVEDRADDYGTFYRVEGVIEGPAGTLSAVCIWLKQAADGKFRFVTMIPAKRRGGNVSTALYRVAIRASFPEHLLRAGDVATLIDFVEHPSSGPRGCVLELFNALGESIGVVTVPEDVVEPLRADEVLSVRPMAVAC